MKVIVPGHITGFFAARPDPDPRRAGSIGAGLNLRVWATTKVEAAGETAVFLNGDLSDAPVSRMVVEELAPAPVRVETVLDMPIGSGFGASGAGSLGCAYALNHLFDLGLTANQIGTAAHEAEVRCRGGLGDVIAQNTGGLVLRLEAGAPGRGVIDRIPVTSLSMDYVVKGPLSTEEVLADSAVMARVNRAGEKALKNLLKKPTLEEFMILSKKFAEESGLIRGWMSDAIEAVEASGGLASMVMLGDSVFALDGAEALSEFGPTQSVAISQGGARIE